MLYMYLCIFYASWHIVLLNFLIFLSYVVHLKVLSHCHKSPNFPIIFTGKKIHVKYTSAVHCSRINCLHFSRNQKGTGLPKDLLAYGDPSSPAPSGHANAPTYLSIISGKARGMERNQRHWALTKREWVSKK